MCLNRWETEQDVLTWESEGGSIIDTTKIPQYSVEQVKYCFTCLVYDAIRHVKQYYYKRAEVGPQPNIAQQVGEFVTHVRRLIKEKYNDLAVLGLQDLTNTDLWSNVGVPNPKYDYRWNFRLITMSGEFRLTLPIAQVLCENAYAMSTTEQTTEEEFREINNTLDNLLREQTALDTFIYKAKDLNSQADVVLNNLYTIAEKLQECENE